MMNENYKILGKYIKDMSSETPDIETFRLLGSTGRLPLELAVKGFLKTGKISEHDALIAKKLAYVLTGGSKAGPFTSVDEQYLLDIERESFVSLCGEQKSLERIKYMLTKWLHSSRAPELPHKISHQTSDLARLDRAGGGGGPCWDWDDLRGSNNTHFESQEIKNILLNFNFLSIHYYYYLL